MVFLINISAQSLKYYHEVLRDARDARDKTREIMWIYRNITDFKGFRSAYLRRNEAFVITNRRGHPEVITNRDNFNLLYIRDKYMTAGIIYGINDSLDTWNEQHYYSRKLRRNQGSRSWHGTRYGSQKFRCILCLFTQVRVTSDPVHTLHICLPSHLVRYASKVIRVLSVYRVLVTYSAKLSFEK